MKTIITLCLAVFFIAGTQNTKAQTKEETIEWLNVNGKSLSYFIEETSNQFIQDYFEKVEEGYLFFCHRYDHKENTSYWMGTYKIPINAILYEDVSTLISGDGYISFKLTKDDYEYIREEKDSNGKKETKTEIRNMEDFTLRTKNFDNYKRVLKAIMHLAKLSGAKENKQTF